MAAFLLGLGQCLTHPKYKNPPLSADPPAASACGQQTLIQQDINTKYITRILIATQPLGWVLVASPVPRIFVQGEVPDPGPIPAAVPASPVPTFRGSKAPSPPVGIGSRWRSC